MARMLPVVEDEEELAPPSAQGLVKVATGVLAVFCGVLLLALLSGLVTGGQSILGMAPFIAVTILLGTYVRIIADMTDRRVDRRSLAAGLGIAALVMHVAWCLLAMDFLRDVAPARQIILPGLLVGGALGLLLALLPLAGRDLARWLAAGRA